MYRPPGCERLFQEDECLRNDPTYPGICGWWKQQFPSRDFNKDWESLSSRDTEIDGGDHFVRVLKVGHPRYKYLTVVFSFDGYSVYKSTEKEKSFWRQKDHERK